MASDAPAIVDVLQVSGRLIDDLPIPAGPLEGASYLESLSLEYAEQCRAVPQLQRLAVRMYLACPKTSVCSSRDPGGIEGGAGGDGGVGGGKGDGGGTPAKMP